MATPKALWLSRVLCTDESSLILVVAYRGDAKVGAVRSRARVIQRSKNLIVR